MFLRKPNRIAIESDVNDDSVNQLLIFPSVNLDQYSAEGRPPGKNIRLFGRGNESVYFLRREKKCKYSVVRNDLDIPTSF